MAALTLPDPPLSDGVVALRGFESSDGAVDKHNPASVAVATRAGFTSVPEPLLQRPETALFVDDVYFARLRGG